MSAWPSPPSASPSLLFLHHVSLHRCHCSGGLPNYLCTSCSQLGSFTTAAALPCLRTAFAFAPHLSLPRNPPPCAPSVHTPATENALMPVAMALLCPKVPPIARLAYPSQARAEMEFVELHTSMGEHGPATETFHESHVKQRQTILQSGSFMTRGGAWGSVPSPQEKGSNSSIARERKTKRAQWLRDHPHSFKLRPFDTTDHLRPG